MYKKKNKVNIIYTAIIILLSFLMIYMLNSKQSFFLNNIIKDTFYLPTRLTPPKQTDLITSNINVELKEENEQLKQLLNIKNTLSEFNVINATVIERNTAYWFNTITINKGTKDNIEVNMAVVTNNGLIGKIENTTYLTSTVKLITSNDQKNKISVRINAKDKSYNAILTTTKEAKLVITGLNKDSKIKIGDKVTTSGLSDIFPSGIIIGKISKIENDEYGVSKKMYVEPTAQIDNVRFVSVLSRKVNND